MPSSRLESVFDLGLNFQFSVTGWNEGLGILVFKSDRNMALIVSERGTHNRRRRKPDRN